MSTVKKLTFVWQRLRRSALLTWRKGRGLCHWILTLGADALGQRAEGLPSDFVRGRGTPDGVDRPRRGCGSWGRQSSTARILECRPLLRLVRGQERVGQESVGEPKASFSTASLRRVRPCSAR